MTPTLLMPLFVALFAATPNLPVTVGVQAPTFTASDCDGHLVDLQATLARGPVVLAFFPKAQTGGCTQEMRAFVQQDSMLQKYHATLLAISRDDAAGMQAFRKMLNATFGFIPDTDGTLMRLYQSKLPLVTVAKRKTFVINPQGTIVYTCEGSDAIALKGLEKALAGAQLGPKTQP